MSFNKLVSSVALVSLLGTGAVVAIQAQAASPNAPAAETPSAATTDSAITAKVKAALSSNKISGVSVRTELGVVVLSGKVPSEDARQAVAKIASSVEGVRGVDYASLAIAS